MHIFQTTSGFKTPNISKNTRWNCNISLPSKNLPVNLPLKTRAKQSLLRPEYFIF